MDLRLRPYCAGDFEFARGLYFETMRWAIERVFGWDQVRQESSFAEWFNPDEISIIMADSADVGWIQQRPDGDAIFLGSIYIAPAMQTKTHRNPRHPGNPRFGQAAASSRHSGGNEDQPGFSTV